MGADSPAAVLVDSSGNAIGVLLDGAVYRLQSFAKITDGTNNAAVKAAATAAAKTDPSLVVGLSPNSNGPFEFGGDQRLRVGNEALIHFDTFEGSSVNAVNWVQSQSGMTQAVANGALTLNSGSSTTNNNYSILSSAKQIRSTVEMGLYFQKRARIVTEANTVCELGWGAVATTAAPTNGCFFRVPSSGVLQVVINFNGTETVTQMAAAGVLASGTFYTFEIFVFENMVVFEVTSADGTTVSLETEINIPNANGSATTLAALPDFARVYNTATAGSAAKIVLGNTAVTQMDSGPALVDTSNITSVTSSASNVTLLASNPNRKGASIFNDSSQVLYVKFGTTASSTSFTVRLTNNDYYEIPFGYVGQVDGIWASANGAARVTELF